MAIWTDNTLTPIPEEAPYVGADGTTFPGQFPKAGIPGLMLVTETTAPDDGAVIVTGWHIELTAGQPTQVWDTEARPVPTAEEAADIASAILRKSAFDALAASDRTALRCIKAGVAFPSEWQAYDAALRAIAGGISPGPLPARPDYPAGT